jgi:hypothetical protein
MSFQQSFTRTVNGAEIEFTEPTGIQKRKIMRKASESVKEGEFVESVAEFEENIEFMVKAVSGTTALRETHVREMSMDTFCEFFYYSVHAVGGNEPENPFERGTLQSTELFDGKITVYEDGVVET